MPSFDVVSEINMHEVTNAVDQASREVSTRYDLKNANASFEHNQATITMHAAEEFHLKAMLDVLQSKLVKRKVDLKCLDVGEPVASGRESRQAIALREGIDQPLAKRLIKLVKDSKLKVQTAIQENKVRVTAKKRDDLQAVMGMFREAKVDLPLQFTNMRD